MQNERGENKTKQKQKQNKQYKNEQMCKKKNKKKNRAIQAVINCNVRISWHSRTTTATTTPIPTKCNAPIVLTSYTHNYAHAYKHTRALAAEWNGSTTQRSQHDARESEKFQPINGHSAGSYKWREQLQGEGCWYEQSANNKTYTGGWQAWGQQILQKQI